MSSAWAEVGGSGGDGEVRRVLAVVVMDVGRDMQHGRTQALARMEGHLPPRARRRYPCADGFDSEYMHASPSKIMLTSGIIFSRPPCALGCVRATRQARRVSLPHMLVLSSAAPRE